MTIHKVQGMTIAVPRSVTSNFQGIFDGSQAYTVLSRIRQLDQLYLINDLYPDKIYTSKKALLALKDLENRAVNADIIGKRDDQIKISFLNVQNLIDHIDDVKHDHKLLESNLILLGETWLQPTQDTAPTPNRFSIPNYHARYSSSGGGVGLATYFEDPFICEDQVNGSTYQVHKFSTTFEHWTHNKVDIEVIGLYRSSRRNTQDSGFMTVLEKLINRNKICIICGDFNIPLRNQSMTLIPKRLQDMGFVQYIDKSTHRSGGIIDHLYIFRPTELHNVVINWDLYSPFYSDHFGITIIK